MTSACAHFRRSLSCFAVLIGLVCCACSGVAAQSAPEHDRAFWQAILRNDGEVPKDQFVVTLAKELNAYLGSPDPELRDDFAYTILGAWIGRGMLPAEELRVLAAQWRANLNDHIGESGTDSVYRRTFSALLLAEIVRRDSRTPFLGADGFRSTLDAALVYLREERDLRGYDEQKGWAHATAHTADLLRACAGHPRFAPSDQARMLAAIAERLASAGKVYTHGEQDRLAQAVVVMAQREDFDLAGFSAWSAQLRKSADGAFASHPVRESALATRENNLQVLRSVYVNLALQATTERRDQAMLAVLATLRR